MAQNEKQWSSAEPGLLVILLDKSGSMNENYQGSETAAEFAAKAVNKVIDNIIQRSFDGEAPKNRCFISVIGYNSNVSELRSGWLKDLAEKPLRYEKMQQKIPDGTGGILPPGQIRGLLCEPGADLFHDCTRISGGKTTAHAGTPAAGQAPSGLHLHK